MIAIWIFIYIQKTILRYIAFTGILMYDMYPSYTGLAYKNFSMKT